MALIYLDLIRFRKVEQEAGPRVASEIMATVKSALHFSSATIGTGADIALQNLWGDDCIV